MFENEHQDDRSTMTTYSLNTTCTTTYDTTCADSSNKNKFIIAGRQRYALLIISTLLSQIGFLVSSEAYGASHCGRPFTRHSRVHVNVLRGGESKVSSVQFSKAPLGKGGSTLSVNSKLDEEDDGTTTTTPPLNGANVNGNGSRSKRGIASMPPLPLMELPPDTLIPTDFIAETNLPTDVGHFRLRAYRMSNTADVQAMLNTGLTKFMGDEPCVIYCTDLPPGNLDGGDTRSVERNTNVMRENVPVRIHDQCFTSEVFRSQRCDCKQQLKMALEFIQKNGGCVIYMQQEGRGIGLANKVAAYALQDQGFDTVDANIHLGFPDDCRQYGVVPGILDDVGIHSIQLITNNPRKVERLRAIGVNVAGTIPLVVKETSKYNKKYIETKVARMNHKNFDSILAQNSVSIPPSTDFGGAKILPVVGNPAVTVAQGLNAASKAALQALLEEDDENRSGVKANAASGYCLGKKSVEDAIAAMQRGELVVVVDDEDRENEGDFVCSADMITAESMATIVRYSSGVVCVSLSDERCNELDLVPMTASNEDPKGTAFTVSVDAAKKHGITTGISARERAQTIKLLADPKMTRSDFNRPGHIFPLRAKAGGTIERDGHTEAALDLSILAGHNPCGVLCEIVSEEDPVAMMRLPEIKRFCKREGFALTSIVDIAQYRREMKDELGW